MKNVLIFSGTTEGRRLAETLVKNGIFCHVCVATEYGLQVMESSELMQVHMGRLDVDAMKELYADIRPDVVIDATHPFAKIVSENIRESLQNRGIPYVRLERRLDAEEDFGKEEVFADSQAVCQALLARQGNILLTTGSKELHIFCRDERLRKRLIVRVLPGMESLSLCYENGLEGNQIIAMQGPFSEEINTAIYRQYDIRHMVTKESGSIGGMEEKLSAARKMGIRSYVIARPKTDTGNWQIYDEKEILAALEDLLGCRLQADDGLTEENEAEVLKEADKAYACGSCRHRDGGRRLSDLSRKRNDFKCRLYFWRKPYDRAFFVRRGKIFLLSGCGHCAENKGTSCRKKEGKYCNPIFR